MSIWTGSARDCRSQLVDPPGMNVQWWMNGQIGVGAPAESTPNWRIEVASRNFSARIGRRSRVICLRDDSCFLQGRRQGSLAQRWHKTIVRVRRSKQGRKRSSKRIRRALDESRQRRREANEAFDAFLRSFGPRSGREPRPVDPRSMDVRSAEAPTPAPVPGGPPAPPPSSAPQLISGHSPVVESQPPITEPLPIAKAPEPPVDEPRPFVSAPPIAERQLLESARLPPWPPPDNASRPSADTTPSLATDTQPPATDMPPLVSALEATASVAPAVPSQSADAPLPVPELPPIAAPAVAAGPEAAASDPGESWIPEPTTPLRLIQEDGTLESLLAEPAQISGPAAADPRGLYPVIPAGLRQSLQRRGLRREHVAAAAVVLVVLAVLLIWGLSSTPDDGDTVQRPSQPSTAPVATAPAQQPAASAPPVSGLQVELRTVRHVWVRVVVDGEKTIEREIPADERIPIQRTERRRHPRGRCRRSAGRREWAGSGAVRRRRIACDANVHSARADNALVGFKQGLWEEGDLFETNSPLRSRPQCRCYLRVAVQFVPFVPVEVPRIEAPSTFPVYVTPAALNVISSPRSLPSEIA